MNTKEENNIELEQIIKETKSRLEELFEDELTKVSGGGSNGVVFEKGKWIKIDGTDDPETEIVFELLELNGNDLLTNIWIKTACLHKVVCLRNKLYPVQILVGATKIDRPSWADE